MEQGRLFKIVYHLLDKGRATAPELAEKFEVSVRTMAYAVKMTYKKTAKGEFKPEQIIDKTIIDTQYPANDFHYIYYGAVEKVLVKE